MSYHQHHQLEVDPDIILDLILQANDVKQNPGPQQQHSGHKLDKVVTELQREVRSLQKVVEHQTTQILGLSRQQQRWRKADEGLGRLGEQVYELREGLECHSSLLRRQRAELTSVGQEVRSVRKLNRNQRNELKHVSTATIEDVKSLKDECSQNLKVLQHQRQGVDDYSKQYTTLNETCEQLQAEQESLKKELSSLKDNYVQQVTSIRQCVEGLAKDLGQQATRQRAMEGEVNRIAEESTVSKSLSMKARQEFGTEMNKKIESLEETGKAQSERLDVITGDIAKIVEKEELMTAQFLQEVACNANAVMESAAKHMETERSSFASECQRLSSMMQEMSQKANATTRNLCERMDDLDAMYDDVQDRVFEIDKARKNNLVFYGVAGEEQDGDECERIIKGILSHMLRVSRELPMTKVSRIWNGPSFRGVKPVQVCFQLFKDKEEVLRRASSMLRGTNVYVTEDFSRKVRRQREQLIKYARDVRARDPSVRCLLRYDRLHVENEIYLYNEVEGKVERVLMRTQEGESGTSGRRKQRDQALPVSQFNGLIHQGIQTTEVSSPCNPHYASRIPRWRSSHTAATGHARGAGDIGTRGLPGRDDYGNGDGLSCSSSSSSDITSDEDDSKEQTLMSESRLLEKRGQRQVMDTLDEEAVGGASRESTPSHLPDIYYYMEGNSL